MWNRKWFCRFLLCIVGLLLGAGAAAMGATAVPAVPSVSAPAALLMEKETGQILFAKDPDTPRAPASVTKIMTLLLAMEALERGALRPDELVAVSRTAQSMEGSRVFLTEGERYTVDDLLKAVVIASGNDAAVALAEHMAGSEDVFVARMNERAAELGMTGTVFLDCTGLTGGGHVSTARDIALMSRALLAHPEIRSYTTVWMDSLRGGAFVLNNTNRLIRTYPGATGLKTGSTSLARFCLSGTAERNGMELIAVILGADTSAQRFEDARTLLDFGFAHYTLAAAFPDEVPQPVPVLLGRQSEVQPRLLSDTRVLVEKEQLDALRRETDLAEDVRAPVQAGQKLGELRLCLGERTLVRVPIVAAESVARLTWFDLAAQMGRTVYR
ncbi:MAG: D-alanyl-D-alanine carboxypeptidase [Oscillospiraceae bacterium]|jgi:D-alanyl-D-alanine carboxypeptidase (penicillin-binding protein 5/6)|nr:D-alanyl-D-alanine carboxypeptidase [Oscillospiraceae bacterium]